MPDDPATPDAATPPPAPVNKKSSGKSTLFIVLGLLTASALAAGGAWLWMTSARAQKAPEAPAIYVPLDPPFVVNFEAEHTVRFLQVSAELMTRDPATADLLKAHDPMVRNDLLLLLGTQDHRELSTREGKEALRQQALETVRKVLGDAGGKPERLEAVYFTSFVMQ